ncbi:hypothetical protein ACLHZU_22640, partial [Aeromonas salmonicida]|uniref:hypothetical protein n=1 Tax=Aeromonas salmonicida TaxID=645 RepID=UPI003D0176D2
AMRVIDFWFFYYTGYVQRATIHQYKTAMARYSINNPIYFVKLWHVIAVYTASNIVARKC